MNKKTKVTTALIVALSVSLIEPSFADENSKPVANINLESSSRPSNNSNTNESVTPPHEKTSENAILEAKSSNQKTTTSKSQSLPFNENFSAKAESQNTVSEQDKSTEANEEDRLDAKLDNNKGEVEEANHNANENSEEDETVNSSNENLDKKTSDTTQEQISPDSHTEEISKSEDENDIEESKKEDEQSNKQIQKSAPKDQSLEVSEIEKKEALTSTEQNAQGSYILSNDDDNTSVTYDNFADLRNALLNLNGNNTLTLNKDLVITDKDNPNNKYNSDYLLKIGKEDSDVNLTIKSSGSEKRKIIYDSSNSKTPPYMRPYSLIGAKYKNTKLTLDNITLDGGNFLGGVTAEKGADITIKNSLIENCSGRSSGGILLREYKISDDEINKLTIIDSIIQNCLAPACGGAILAENNSIIDASNSKFLNNSTDSGDGGAIGLKGDKETSDNITATVNNCTFENNKKGAIVSRSEKTLTVKNSTFKNNKGIHNGGAISMNSGNLVVDNSNFEGNETGKGSYMGGAIFINNNYYGKITNSTFKKNKSIKNHGGAIASNGSLEIKNSTFEENTAKRDGGAIYVNIGTENGNVDAKIDIDNITVNKNKAEKGNGGGLYLAINHLYYNAGKGEFLGRHNTIKNSTITNNEAKYGGGLYLSEIGADIEDTKILNNTYTAQGGGIFATIDKQFPDGNTNDIKLVNSEIKNNKIKEGSIGDDINGGGAYISKGNIVTDNSTIEANEAQYGGGVYLEGNSKLKSSSSSFKNNKAIQDGGAIFTEIHSYGKDKRDDNYKYPPLPGKHYTNIEVDENSEFNGNTARKFFKEPYNYKEFSNIKSKSQSAPEGDKAKHIINNYDINFRVYPIISFNLNDPNQEKQELDKKIILEEGETLKQDKFPTENDLSNVKNKIFIGWSFDKDAKPTDTDKLITGDNPIFRQKLTKDGKEIDTDEITIYAIWQTKTKVSYTYVSDDPKIELPTEILNSKPRDQEVEFGTEIDPTKLVKFTKVEGEIDGRKGKWILKNWDPGTTTLNEKEHKDGLTFIATWKFEEDKPNPDNPNPDKPNPDRPNPDKPNPDKPNPDETNPDKPNPDKPNPDKPNPDKPNPGESNPDNPNPNKPNEDSSTPDNPESPKDSETSKEYPKDDDNQEDTPHQKDNKDNDEDKNHKINKGDAIGVKTKKSTNPKTGIDSIIPIITSMGISITGILATRKRKEN